MQCHPGAQSDAQSCDQPRMRMFTSGGRSNLRSRQSHSCHAAGATPAWQLSDVRHDDLSVAAKHARVATDMRHRGGVVGTTVAHMP